MPAFLKDQACVSELSEMEGEGAVRQPEFLGDRSRGKAIVTGLDKQSEQSEPMRLRQGGQRIHGVRGFHQRKFAQ